MKKRLLSLLLVLMLCITMIPSANVFAAVESSQASTKEIQSFATEQNYSDWAFHDLIDGETYGIYPISWYEKDMTAPITNARLRILMSGLRYKMLATNCVTGVTENYYRLKSYPTVKEVLKAFYTLVSSYEFTTDIGLKDISYDKFMKDNKIYTGENGEQATTELCSMEQACVIATRLVTNIYDKLDSASKGFLWVTKANGNTVYMLGSIHMATNDIYPMNDELIKAYNSADALAVEVNIFDQAGAMALVNLAVYSDGTTLKDHVSQETYDKAIALAASFGYAEVQIAMLKPWYVFSMFSSLSLTDSGSAAEANQAVALGIDYHFIVNSILSGKPVLEVEGYTLQGEMFNSFSDELQEYLLKDTIDAVNEVIAGTNEEGSEDLDLMLDLWRKGDTEGFAKYTSFEYEYQDILTDDISEQEMRLVEEFKEKLFTQRDKGMAGYIDGLLQAEGEKTYFVIVGSGHYISDYDVLDILTKKGYQIDQVK